MRSDTVHSLHLYNAPCPKCRELGNDKAGDNLAVYSDGHKFCYACRYYCDATLHDKICSHEHVKPIQRSLHLPDDANIDYPVFCVDWIKKYELTKKDMLNNKMLFSEKGINFKEKKAENLLLFPCWEGDTLQAYQARYFGHDKSIPKYLGRGKLDKHYHFIFNGKPGSIKDSNILVITEDLLSSIKVSKLGVCTMPLWGNNFTNRIDMLLKLTTINHKVLLWLDPDMTIKSVKESNVARLKGLQCTSIHSTHDPKEHSYSEIENYLKG